MSESDFLIVDDERDRFALRYILEREGIVVHETADGPSALAAVRDHDPLAVLVALPGSEGLELIERLVKEPRDTAVLVGAKRAAMGDISTALHQGAWDFLLKPYSDAPGVVRTVTRVMERANHRRRSRPSVERVRLAIRSLAATLADTAEPTAPAFHELPQSSSKPENPVICRP